MEGLFSKFFRLYVKVFIQDINSRRYLNLSRIDSNNNMGYLFMTIE